jgi:hypothetical protein
LGIDRFVVDNTDPIMDVEDKITGEVLNTKEKCTGHHHMNSLGKCVKPDQDDWKVIYKKYPELKPDKSGRMCKKSEQNGIYCRERALKDDLFCLFHTKKNLFKYEIPFLCNKKKKNGRRCTRFRLQDREVCHLHKMRELDRDRLVDQSKLGHKAKEARAKKMEKALKSFIPVEWAGLLKWSYREPRDVIRLCEEIANRLRWGTVPLNIAEMLLQVGKMMLDSEQKILEIKAMKEETLLEEARKQKSEIGRANQAAISLKDRIKNASANVCAVEV